ncbi:MAG: hypothetical protein R3F45_02910 [Gammaproteobacteria bacterium]
MTLGIAQLITAYVVLAAVLAGLNIFSTLSWLMKAVLLVATSAAYLVLYFSFPPMLGWPSSDDLPKRFGLIALYVQEPDRITGAKGNVFFWVTDKTSNSIVPRAYLLDYEPELHARAKEARAKLQKNVPQVGEATSGDEMDLTRMGKPGEERQGAKTHKYTVKFFDAAPDAPPSKTAEMAAPTGDDAPPPPAP